MILSEKPFTVLTKVKRVLDKTRLESRSSKRLMSVGFVFVENMFLRLFLRYERN